MRYPKLGLCEVCAVLVILCGISSSTFEASPAAASTTGSQIAGERPSDSGMPMAVLRGKIRFTGTVPSPTLFNTAPDPSCAPFIITSEDVRVSDQGLENVMVYVSSPVASPAPIGSAVTLDQRDCRFDPHVLTLQAGQALIVRNSDNTLQNVHAFTQVNTPFNTGQPIPMATSHIFDKPEAQIPIRDDIHRWKVAYVGVFDHPYHTVSKSGGLYELRLPAGRYEITVWHEKYGKFQQTVVLKPGENPSLDFVYNVP